MKRKTLVLKMTPAQLTACVSFYYGRNRCKCGEMIYEYESRMMVSEPIVDTVNKKSINGTMKIGCFCKQCWKMLYSKVLERESK